MTATDPITTGPRPLRACVEVGGSSAQTVVFRGDDIDDILPGAHQPEGAALGLAVPGLVAGGRVIAASTLGWFDVDPVASLGLAGPAVVVRNDGEAAALGEAALRLPRLGDPSPLPSLVYVGLGTGVGGAVVAGGAIVAGNLFGHAGGFGPERCLCGRSGCLETVAAGWALPTPLAADDLEPIGAAVAAAIRAEAQATPTLVVVGGGMARRHPRLVELIAGHLDDRDVEPSRAPERIKSASPFGIAHEIEALERRVA